MVKRSGKATQVVGVSQRQRDRNEELKEDLIRVGDLVINPDIIARHLLSKHDRDARYPCIVGTSFFGFVEIQDGDGHFTGEDPTIADVVEARNRFVPGSRSREETSTSIYNLAHLLLNTVSYHQQLAYDGLEEAQRDASLL